MYCPKCGKKVQTGVKVCEYCGTAVQMGKSMLLIEEEEENVENAAAEQGKEAAGSANVSVTVTPAASAVSAAPAQPAKAAKPAKKKRSALPVIIVLLVIAALAGAGVFIYLKFFTYRTVKIEDCKGDTELERKGDEKEIFEGLKLIPEDVVTTGDNGLVELFIDSDKHVVAEANTCFSINAVGSENSGKVTISLEYGSTLIEIDEKLAENSEFEVETPNATCSVRGTTFRASYAENSDTTRIEVSEGVVRVKAGGESIDLNAGESASVTGDKIYTPVNFAKAEVVTIGNFEGTPLEWYVLEDTGDEKLLLLKDTIPTEGGDIEAAVAQDDYAVWADSKLRSWLNTDFYNDCFTDEERGRILLSTVKTAEVTDSDPEEFAWGKETETQDYIYCLSIKEYTNYFKIDNYGCNGLYAYSMDGIRPDIYGNGSVLQRDFVTTEVYHDRCVGMTGTRYYLRDTSPDGVHGLSAEAIWTIDISGATHAFLPRTASYIRPVMRISYDASEENLTEPAEPGIGALDPEPEEPYEPETPDGAEKPAHGDAGNGSADASGTDHTLGPDQPGNGGNNEGNNGNGGGNLPDIRVVTADEIIGTWRGDGNCTNYEFYADGTGKFQHDSFGSPTYFTWSVDGGRFTCSSSQVYWFTGDGIDGLCDNYMGGNCLLRRLN